MFDFRILEKVTIRGTLNVLAVIIFSAFLLAEVWIFAVIISIVHPEIMWEVQ